jgi:hypothetical protein
MREEPIGRKTGARDLALRFKLRIPVGIDKGYDRACPITRISGKRDAED